MSVQLWLVALVVSTGRVRVDVALVVAGVVARVGGGGSWGLGGLLLLGAEKSVD